MTIISIGSQHGHTTVIALCKNKHGQKCAIVRCECGNEICRVLHRVEEGRPCRTCSRHFFDKQGRHTTSRSRVAARYAHLAKVSILRAAETIGINPGAVWSAWARIYPDLAQPITEDRKKPGPSSKPKHCAACDGTGHVAVGGRCSRSEHAVRLVRTGISVQTAADRIGITNQTVYAALQRRRAA